MAIWPEHLRLQASNKPRAESPVSSMKNGGIGYLGVNCVMALRASWRADQEDPAALSRRYDLARPLLLSPSKLTTYTA